MNSRVPTNKWLFASVAINLLFIGALTGRVGESVSTRTATHALGDGRAR